MERTIVLFLDTFGLDAVRTKPGHSALLSREHLRPCRPCVVPPAGQSSEMFSLIRDGLPQRLEMMSRDLQGLMKRM